MVGWIRPLISTSVRARPILMSRINAPSRMQIMRSHDHGPPQPFDNLPFSIPNRFVATAVFGVFFGIGLYAPFLILWYMMAKKTL